MTISLIVVITSCLSAMTFLSSTALAAGGRIAFSGSIVEPTCNATTAESTIAAIAASSIETLRLTCAKPGVATAGAPEAYVMTIKRLSSSESDRVLKYFDTYVKASRPEAADPTLLTQTYE
jgi:hypothetical protein